MTRTASRARIQLAPLSGRRRWPWRKTFKIIAWIVGPVVVVVGILSLYYYPKAKATLAAVNRVEVMATRIQQAVSDQKFDQAHAHVKELQAALTDAQTSMDRMQGLRSWPYVGRQYQAGRDLLVVGQHGAKAGDALVDFADHLFSPFADQGKVSLATINAEQKGQLLAGISERESSLREAQVAINQAAKALDRVPADGLVGPLRRVVVPLKEQFPLIQQGLQQAIPATRILPAVLGYPEEKTYLFLLENNTELRPGGGFIGTYGILRLASGEIISLTTDNSYNLDEAAKNLPVVQPPDPLIRYLKARNWYFRDSNWSPDFPTSAQQALVLYKREGGRRDIDGVMAVTPTAISSLLELVGPITVHGLEFTAENFTDRLQRFVDIGFQSVGLDESERKDIIGPLTNELVDRLLRLPVSDWGDLFLVLNQQLREKQFLLYMEDAGTQSILVEQNWAGSFTADESADSVMVVDANLASLKTDPAMRRTYDYAVKLTAEGAEATLKITYQHTGKFDWKTTRYNTFTRVYVPAGSILLDAQGAQLREKSQRAGEVTTSTELGKTVFSAFKSIEPGTTDALTLHYQLPAKFAEQLKATNRYHLIWQKQAGLMEARLNLRFHLPNREIDRLESLDTEPEIRNDTASASLLLREDQTVALTTTP